MSKKYLSEIIMPEEVRNWDRGQIYSISAPTSSGKTTFAFNTLFEIAKERNKKILIFSNRKILEAQLFKQISGKEEYIDIVMYQKLEHFKEVSEYTFGLFDYSFGEYSELLDFRKYEFIIFDEAHSIFTDYFDTYRENILDIMFNKILGIYVLLSATIEICYSYFQIPDENRYFIEKDYNYIDKIYYYNKKNLVQIIESIPASEKILIFVNSAEHGRDLKKLLSDAEFICSKSRKNIYKNKMANVVNEIIENETFSTRVLIATKVIDNGINIKDEKVKHIFIEFIYDTDIIQALGRLRIEEQRINLYIPDLSKKYFSTIMNEVSYNLNIVFDYLCFLEDNDYDKLGETDKILIRMKYLNENRKGDLRIINNDGTLNKAKYICMQYFEKQLGTIKKMGYLKYVAELLYNNQNKADNFIKFENMDFKHFLNNSLDSFLGNRMYKDDRKGFKKFLQDNSMVCLVKRTERLKSMSLSTINKCFEELELPYKLDNIQDKERSSLNYNKTYWVLTKLI